MAGKFAKPVGALWCKENDKVGEFMTGNLDLGAFGSVAIAVFPNNRKEEGKNHPDYRIVLSGNFPERGSEGGRQERRRESGRRQAKARPQSADDQLPY